jgi:hypothetical protein
MLYSKRCMCKYGVLVYMIHILSVSLGCCHIIYHFLKLKFENVGIWKYLVLCRCALFYNFISN